MITDIKIHRPEPIVVEKKLEIFNRATDVKETIRRW